MRFTLFAAAQGVQSDLAVPFWATESSSGVVTDASLSARRRGVRPGMLMRTAKALIPELTGTEETDGLPKALDKILRTVLKFTPWIEVIDKSAFYFQIPSERPPLQEVKQILNIINQQLTEEQSVQVGFARTSKLARALVEWNQVERVPGALYWRVGRQLWLVAPSLARIVSGKADVTKMGNQGMESENWILEMPIPAFWDAPANVRDRLMSLGVYRISELAKVPVSYLKRQFGEASLAWTEFSHLGSERLRVNYPPQKFVKEWVSSLGEEVPGERIAHIIEDLAQGLANELRRSGLGALRIGVLWKSDRYERAIKRPAYQAEQIIAAVEPGYQACQVDELSYVQLYAADIHPLTSVQVALSEGRPEEKKETVDVLRVVRHVNHKFPDAIQRGLRPSFRELRLQAVMEGREAGFASRIQ